MATDAFQGLVAALWSRLGMEPPTFSEDGRIALRIDRVSLQLTDDRRGSLVIDGVAGPLARGEPARAAQVRQILQSNVGLLVGNDAGVYLRPSLDGGTAVAVRALHPLRDGRMDRLVQRIEDVVRVIEYYAGELKSANVGETRRQTPRAAPVEAAVIFRP